MNSKPQLNDREDGGKRNRVVRSLENLEILGEFVLVRENLENLEKSGNFVEVTPKSFLNVS